MSDHFEDPGPDPGELPEQDPLLGPLAAGLPRSVEPERDLWPGIRRTLTPAARPAPRRRAAWVGMAAAVLAVAAAAWFVGPARRAPARETRMAPLPGDDYGLTLWRAMEAEGRGAREEFRAAVERPDARLRPYDAGVVEGNLEILDQAIGETAAALAEHPRDRRLLELLAEHHRQRMALVGTAIGT